MDLFSYHTIEKAVSGLYKEKGSKFIAQAYPVTDEQQIKQQLEILRKEYYDARHHCFAWILGADQNKFRTFDDGEPNHSAGDPILGQIRSRNLTNVLVVVIRYFGGVKLGVGGLVAAYKASADDALNKAVIIEKEVTRFLQLDFDYTATPDVMRLIKDFDATVLSQQFELKCSMSIEVPLKMYARLLEKIHLLQVTGTSLLVETR